MNELNIPNNQQIHEGIRNIIDYYWNDGIDENSETKSQSSFWKYYASLARVNFEDHTGVFKFEGTMFGDYKSKSLNQISGLLPVNFFTRYLRNKLSPKIRQAVLQVCKSHNREVSFDCLKQGLTIQKVMQNGLNLKNKRIAIIGDGYGFLGCLLKCLDPSVRIVSVNLGKISVFDVALTSVGYPSSQINFVNKDSKYEPNYDFNFAPAETIFESGINDIDIFFNIASMQEMTQQTIDSYFVWMRSQKLKSTYFYCCNRVSKTLPDGETLEFEKYGWKESDKIIFDELCPWYKGSPMNRPPFWKKFDGDVWHRFSKLR